MLKKGGHVLGEVDSCAPETLHHRPEGSSEQRLLNVPTETDDPAQVELTLGGSVVDAGRLAVESMQERAHRVLFVDELEARIEAGKGGCDLESEIAAQSVVDVGPDDAGQAQSDVVDFGVSLGDLGHELLEVDEAPLMLQRATRSQLGCLHGHGWLARSCAVYGGVRLDDDLSGIGAALDSSKQGLSAQHRDAAPLASLIDDLEMKYGVRPDLEQVPGEVDVVEPTPAELGGELESRRPVADGEDLYVRAVFEALHYPATDPARGASHEDAFHPPRLTRRPDCYRRRGMRALLYEFDGPGVPPSLIELADEMSEDPRCRVLIVGGDAVGSTLVSVWDEDVTDEVAAGLGNRDDGGRVRSLEVPSDMAIWR